jgi:3-(3-hydroxy-phenyl)propionate hydroxylase
VGLTLALDLAKRDVPSSSSTTVTASAARGPSAGPRRWRCSDRLGVGEAIARDGVRWQRGRVFHGDEACGFDLLPGRITRCRPWSTRQDQVEARLVRAVQLESRISCAAGTS